MAGRPHPELVTRGVAALKAAGYRVRLGDQMRAGAYLAGSDEARAEDLTRALRDPEVDAVICARGGYGTMRLLERLEPGLLRRHPKWLVGYSDITALHLWAIEQGVACVHGPLVESLAKHADHLAPLMQQLAAPTAPRWTGLRTWVPGIASGPLVGGNLSLLAALIGTRWLPSLEGRLLFVEEIAEPMYRVDRMIQTLILDGRARGLAGVVLGDFTRCGATGDDPQAVIAEVAALFAPLGVPLVSGLPVGHGDRNTPVVQGVAYTLDATHGVLEPARNKEASVPKP